MGKMERYLPKSRLVGAAILMVLLFAVSGSAAKTQRDSDAKKLFDAKCAICHGTDGSGKTPAGTAMQAADLRSPEIQKKSDAELAKSISDGKGKMIAFKNALSPEQIRSLVAYIRQFAHQK